jgi:hypothetical protein
LIEKCKSGVFKIQFKTDEFIFVRIRLSPIKSPYHARKPIKKLNALFMESKILSQFTCYYLLGLLKYENPFIISA